MNNNKEMFLNYLTELVSFYTNDNNVRKIMIETKMIEYETHQAFDTIDGFDYAIGDLITMARQVYGKYPDKYNIIVMKLNEIQNNRETTVLPAIRRENSLVLAKSKKMNGYANTLIFTTFTVLGMASLAMLSYLFFYTLLK